MDQDKFKKGKIQQAGSIVPLCLTFCLCACLVLVLVQVLIDVELEAIIVHFLYQVVADGTDFLYMTQNVGVEINLINVCGEALATHRADFHGLSNGILKAVLSLTVVAVGGGVLSLGRGSCGEWGVHLIVSHLEVITAVVHTDLPYLDVSLHEKGLESREPGRWESLRNQGWGEWFQGLFLVLRQTLLVVGQMVRVDRLNWSWLSDNDLVGVHDWLNCLGCSC